MPHDPGALLCEHCGYDLTGLPPTTNCPECATPVGASLPENRTGSPWQRAPGPRAFLATLVLPYRRPLTMWNRLRVDRPASDEFALATLSAAALIPVAARVAHDPSVTNPLAALVATLVVGAIALAVLVVCVYIEIYGIRFFGRNHDWRITNDVAHTICAHATPGWLVGSVGVVGVTILDRHLPLPRWLPPQVPLGAAVLLGLLAFESLVYIGMRRMRFANRPDATLTPS